VSGLVMPKTWKRPARRTADKPILEAADRTGGFDDDVPPVGFATPRPCCACTAPDRPACRSTPDTIDTPPFLTVRLECARSQPQCAAELQNKGVRRAFGHACG
jgi:hypothetical protein